MAYSSDLRKRVLAFIEAGGKKTQAERASHFGVSEFCVYYGLKTLGIRRKKHSDIRSDVRKNDPSTGKNSQHSSKLANPLFTPMKVVSETKVIDVTGMPRKE